MLTKIRFLLYYDNIIKNITNLIRNCQTNNTCTDNYCIKLNQISHFYQYLVTE